MCNSPIKLKNPNRGRFISPSNSLVSDTKSQYILAPCGKCSACRFVKQSSLFQRMLVESWHSYVYFCTLTYNNDSILTVDLGDETFTMAPYEDIQKMLKRFRNDHPFQDREFKYLFVREYGKKGRAHWHGLFFIDKADDLDSSLNFLVFEKELSNGLKKHWRRNISNSDKKPIYKPIYTHAECYRGGKLFCNFDCHYVTTNVFGDDQNPLFYVLKYISKDSKLYQKMYCLALEEFGKDTQEFHDFIQLARPRVWKSIGFGIPDDPGLIPKMIARSIDQAEPYPKFYDRACSYPLASYYRNKYMSFEQMAHFCEPLREFGFVINSLPDAEYAKRAEDSKARSLETLSEFDIVDLLED